MKPTAAKAFTMIIVSLRKYKTVLHYTIKVLRQFGWSIRDALHAV